MQKSNWKKCKIRDTSIEIIDGDRGKHYPKNNELLPHGFCLFLNTKNLPGSVFDFSSTQFISQEKDSALRKGKLQNNDIVFTTRGTLGHLAWFKDNILYKNVRINSGMVILRNKDNLIDTKFLFLQLASSFVRKQIAGLSTGSAQPQLPIKDFLNLEIYLPPIEEQKRIAGVLGAFDDKIELLQKQNTTLENMAKALFKSWFVDFDVVHAKQQGQPKAAVMQQYHLTEELYNLFPSSFEPSALGPIPTGWQVKKITEFVNFEKGIEPGSKNYTHQFAKGINLPFYRVQDISSYGNKSQTFVSPELLKNKIFDNDDILVSLDATLGRVFIGAYGGFSSGIRKIITKNDSLSKTYILCFLRSSYFKHMLEQYAGSETTIKHAGKAIDHLQIVYDQKIVDNFNDNLKNIFPKLLTNLDQIQTLTEMRDGLLPRLISGKIRV